MRDNMKLPIREQWNRNIFLDDETVVKYSVLKENKQLFASKYKLYLPSEKELIAEIVEELDSIEEEAKRTGAALRTILEKLGA